ncbi:hypothetical protein BU15DRAFT_64861 [Melanogaster broomeanus]|nr:hypothetical protein BU15DRAFT_64861 [Melanogaster broomeanus]
MRSYKLFRILWPVVAQLCIFMFACAWLGEEITRECISFNSFLTQMINAEPRISTTVVTLMATVLSLASSALLGYSVKEATRHRLRNPRTLIEVSAGVALVERSFWWESRHILLSIQVLFVYGVIQLLVTGWTTLLAPTVVLCEQYLTGTELDLTSPAFSELLALELGTFAKYVLMLGEDGDDAFPLLDVGGSLSGISAAGISFGMPGIINFNEAKYNLSTRGVLPAIDGFAGATTPPSRNGTRLQFSGGATIVDATVKPGASGSTTNWFGQRNYTVDQQGLTADINCQSADDNTLNLNLNLTNLNNTFSVYAPGNTTASTLIVWNSTASCNASSVASQQYVTLANASVELDVSGTGFLPTVVCPGHINGSDIYSRFGQSFRIFTPRMSLTVHRVPVIATQGFDKYDFLPSTVCEVTPLITTTRVSYVDGGTINPSQIISNQSFSPNDTELLFYLASVANYYARNSQGLANNIIGDTLYSVYSGRYTTPIGSNTSQIYRELEDYWRGVIEFSATYLRAGYSAEGSFTGGTIPSEMASPLNGTVSILTVGWANRGPIYIFSILPLGIVTVLTVMAAVYSAIASLKHPEQQTSFNISNTLHLIMATAEGSAPRTGDLPVGSDGSARVPLASQLQGFDQPTHNENVKVTLVELAEDHRKLLVAVPTQKVSQPEA